MCQYCLAEAEAEAGGGMSLLPLVTRLRRLYRRACCGRGGAVAGAEHEAGGGVTIPVDTLAASVGYSDSGSGTLQCPPDSAVTWPPSLDSVAQQGTAPLLLQKEGVRVLLFRECDTRGRKLLYDSKTVVQVPLGDAAPHATPAATKTLFKGSWGSVGGPTQHQGQNKSPAAARTHPARIDTFAEISGGYGYQYQQKEGDTKAVGELVFGSVDLAYRGSCSKLHLLQESPQRVLLSRTAPAPASHLPRLPAASDPGIEDGSFSSSISSLGDAAVAAGSLEVPWGVGGPHTLAIGVPGGLGSSHSEGDSGFGGPPSPYSSTCGSFLSPTSVPTTPHGTPSSRQGSGSSLKNSGSLNSLQRRFLRSVNTSLEGLGAWQEEGGGGGASPSHHSHRRATKLGLAVLIQLQGHHHHLQESVEDWLFLHLGVIESAVSKLQSSLHSAYLHRQSFVSTTHAAVSKLQQDLVDLVSGPRLCRPVWLGLLGQSAAAAERHALCTSFVDTLAVVLGTFDTKQTNFFVSKVLTAVLTHHLGWVSTVAPSDPPTVSSLTTTSTMPGTTHLPSFTPAQPSWAERLSESHPYSAVWAQLCELSGAVGYPPRAARTVLLGSNISLLQHLLTILSYVIRCSQVVEQQVESPQGSPSVAPAVPRHLQAGSSQCSSAASIATIVEEVPPSLQREASLRHSRRTNRGGARAGHGDLRGSTGTVEGAEELLRPAPDQGGREGGEGGRWMLNDGEEIVIRGGGEGGRPPSPHPGMEATTRGPDLPPCPSEITTDHFPQTLSTCKTSFDLASLAGGEGEGDSLFLTPTPALLPASSSLYPALHHLDDHRETFGPVVLEPEKIAEKVHKLFRGSPKRETDPAQPTQRPAQPTQTPPPTTQSPQAPVAPPRTRRSLSGKVESSRVSGVSSGPESAGLRRVCCLDRVIVPAKDIHPEVEEGGRVLLLHHSIPSYTYTHTHSDSRLHAHSDSHIKDLHTRTHPQAESHLHAHSDSHIRTHPQSDSRLHSDSHIHTHPHSDTHLHAQSDTHIHTRTQLPTTSHSHSDTFINTKMGAEQGGIGFEELTGMQGDRVTCLPHPVDTRRRVRSRNLGRESARDLTKLEAERTVYPALSDLKEDAVGVSVKVSGLGWGFGRITGAIQGAGMRQCGAREVTQTHRRHHSDPTNGVFATMPSPGLKEVVEEQTDSKASSHPHTCRKGVETGVGEPEYPASDTKPSGETEQQQKEQDTTQPKEESLAGGCEDPVVIAMPMCVCVPSVTTTTTATTTTTRRHGLAGSLLGGVLDHYASPFVLHATTQTYRWEDALRQDLSATAHHSPLDPQLAEAVAVVADTDSWEVQVVSSHSYVVGGGGGVGGCSGGGLVGVRVDASPLISSITDSVLDLTRLGTSPLFVVQHLEERLSELYLKSQLLAQYLLGGAVGGAGGATSAPYHLPDLTRALGLDVNDLPLLLAVASTHTPALTHMYGLCVR